MLPRLSHTQLLRYAGLFTWAVVGVSMLYGWLFPIEPLPGGLDEPLPGPGPSPVGQVVAHLGFGACYWWITRALGLRRPGLRDDLLLLALTCFAIAVSYFTATGLGSILLMVLAGVLPWLLPLPLAAGWLVVGHLAVVPIFMRGLGYPLVEALIQSLAYVGFSSFVFVTALVAKQQLQAREEQRRLNSELRATRALLAESARINERTRISRELHDLLGHHLTALSLNLEVASHLAQGKAQEHVRQGQTLAKLLLADVREAVSQIREGGAMDLSTALHTLVEGVPALDITLSLPEPFVVDDAERAHVLLRCAQELITNTVRHAGARRLALAFAREGHELVLRSRDDGRGASPGRHGNGLTGMHERLQALGGTLRIRTAPGEGYQVEIRLPLAAGLVDPGGAMHGAPATEDDA